MKILFAGVLITILAIGIRSCSAKVLFGTPPNRVQVSDSNTHYLKYVRYITVPIDKQTGASWHAGDDVARKTPAEIRNIVDAIKALETDPRLTEMYAKMASTLNEEFSFYDTDHARAIVKQRLATLQKMDDFNNAPYIYRYVGSSNPASTTATHWATGTRRPYYLQQVDGSAYDAITTLCAPPSQIYGECWGAIIACIWWGAAQAMGEEDFNTLYPGSTALNMDDVIPPGNGSWKKNLEYAIYQDVYIPGDWVYFKNYNYNRILTSGFAEDDPQSAEFYKKGWLDPHYYYLFSGENALYLGSNLYGGLGADLWNKSKEKMKEELQKSYNIEFDKLIQAVAVHGGTYNGLTIKKITDVEIPVKITVDYVRRVTHK